MKKILAWLKEKTVILLNHIIGLLIILNLFEEYNNFVYILIISLTIISFTLSKYMSKTLEKYELKTKIWHYIGAILINILLAVMYILIQLLLKFDLSYYLTDILGDNSPVPIYTLIYSSFTVIVNFIYWTILICKKINKKEKKPFVKKIVKYTISMVLLNLYIYLIMNTAYYEILELLIVIFFLQGLLHLSLSISPLFEFICKKTNKSFNGVSKTLFMLIPMMVSLFLFIMLTVTSYSSLYMNVDIAFLYFIICIVISILYIVFCILFFVLNKRKYGDTSKTKVWKVILTIIICIVSFVILTIFFVKIILINNTNKNSFLEEKETIKLEHKDLKQSDYLDIEWLKIKNDFQNAYTDNNNDYYRIVIEDKTIIFSKPLEMIQESYFYDLLDQFLNIIYNLEINNRYEYYEFIYKNAKLKLNIFDNFGSIISTRKIEDCKQIYKIDYGNYIAFMYVEDYNYYDFDQVNLYVNLYDVENNKIYPINFINYTKEEILDLISTIKIDKNYKESELEPKLYTSEESLYNYGDDYIERYFDNLDAEIKCHDEKCNSKSMIIGNNKYDLNNYDIKYNENFMLLINRYEDYNKLQIFDKNGIEVANTTYEDIVKIGETYKIYGLRYKDGKFYYYENINEEYIHKTIDTNNNFIIENYAN